MKVAVVFILVGNIQKAEYAAVRTKYVALANSCNSCHQAFARDAPTIKP
jgi:cytochrome c556